MTQKDKKVFEQQYLYIEEVPQEIMYEIYAEEEKKKNDESARGVIILNIVDDD